MYGDYMQSEIVHLAHHGNIGCEIPLYETIAPTVVLWPHTPKQYSEWGKNNSQDFHVQVDTYVCQTLASVKYIYMADPEYATTLKLTASGPDYDNIYNVWDGNKKLSYGTLSGSAVLYPHAYKK